MGGIERGIGMVPEEEQEGGRERIDRSANRNARVATDEYTMDVKHQSLIRSAVGCCSLLSIFDSFSSVPSTSFEEEEVAHSSLPYK